MRGRAVMARLLKSLWRAGVGTMNEALVMERIASERPLTITDISEALDLPIATASRTVWQLCELGLAKQEVDPEDRRLRYVHLTARGEAALQGDLA